MPELLLGAGEAVEGALLCADRLGRVGCAALLRRALQQDETHSRRGVCSGDRAMQQFDGKQATLASCATVQNPQTTLARKAVQNNGES